MKIIVDNVHNRSIGFKGNYFSAVSRKAVAGNFGLLGELLNHSDLKVHGVEIEQELTAYNFTMEELELLAEVEGVDYQDKNKSEIVKCIKGEDLEEPEEEEEEPEEGDI